MKKLTKQNAKKVKDFYENVIMKQIIEPTKINEVFSLIDDREPSLIQYFLKQRTITLFVNNKLQEAVEDFKELIDSDKLQEELQKDKTVTAEPTNNPSIKVEQPSHKEKTESTPKKATKRTYKRKTK